MARQEDIKRTSRDSKDLGRRKTEMPGDAKEKVTAQATWQNVDYYNYVNLNYKHWLGTSLS